MLSSSDDEPKSNMPASSPASPYATDAFFASACPAGSAVAAALPVSEPESPSSLPAKPKKPPCGGDPLSGDGLKLPTSLSLLPPENKLVVWSRSLASWAALFLRASRSFAGALGFSGSGSDASDSVSSSQSVDGSALGSGSGSGSG